MCNKPPDFLQPVLSCLAFFALSCGAAVAAEKTGLLFKCVNPAGVISIQSEACAKGSTEAWRRSAIPEPAPTAAQAEQAEAKRLRDQQTVRELSEIVERKLQPQPAPGARRTKPADEAAEAEVEAPAVDACDAAQVFAASLRDKPWLALTDEQTRRLYGWVAEQCKAPARSN